MQNRISRKAGLALAAGVVGALAVAAPALATTESVGGGTWEHGVTAYSPAGKNYSNYYHGSRAHRSSVQNAGGLVRSSCVGAGSWSVASQHATPRGNKAYWSIDACA